MKRVHRTFWERFSYMAVYECRSCHAEEFVPRHYRYHLFGANCQCPQCGTLRVTRLRERDQIDPMAGGFLNLLERMAGGKLHHCRFCRLQFYDRRGMPGVNPPEIAGDEGRSATAAAPPA